MAVDLLKFGISKKIGLLFFLTSRYQENLEKSHQGYQSIFRENIVENASEFCLVLNVMPLEI